jgi:SAM-dependent methyltransferase
MTTSWGNVADWYDDLLKEDDTYQSKVILPNLLRLVAPKKEEKILDLACGQGFFSRAFSAGGANVIGVDISKELIEKASNGHLCAKVTIATIAYHVTPSHKLNMIEENSIEKAVIVLALQNIEKIKETLEECARVLKPSGKLFIVLNHPAFRIPKRSSWGYDEGANIQYRRLDGYLSEAKIAIDMHPGKAGQENTISFHRPLQVYFKHLSKAGFAVTKLEEWNSHKKSEKGKRSEAEDRARKEIPLFLCLEATMVTIVQ